jgi:mRNA-degrading endonuclease RelE of RelBE toxin-antitoxin system
VISLPVRTKPSPRFVKSCAKLREPLTSRINSALRKFHTNPDSPGLNFEALKNAPRYFTIRVDRNFRILLKAEVDKEGPYFLLIDVASHDDIYFRRRP